MPNSDGGAGRCAHLRASQGDTVHLVPVEQVMYLAADKYVRASPKPDTGCAAR